MTNHKPQTTNHKPQTTNHKPQGNPLTALMIKSLGVVTFGLWGVIAHSSEVTCRANLAAINGVYTQGLRNESNANTRCTGSSATVATCTSALINSQAGRLYDQRVDQLTKDCKKYGNRAKGNYLGVVAASEKIADNKL